MPSEDGVEEEHSLCPLTEADSLREWTGTSPLGTAIAGGATSYLEMIFLLQAFHSFHFHLSRVERAQLKRPGSTLAPISWHDKS